MDWIWVDRKDFVIEFLFGVMIGFVTGYPLGLWAMDYTRRYNERQKYSRTDK